MNRPALLFNGIYLYWHGLFMTAAIVLAVIAALTVSKAFQKKTALAVFDTSLLSVPVGILLARMLYCISNFEEYPDLREILRLTDGGYGLYGAILGVFVSASMLYAMRRNFRLGAVCDALAVGGALGIAAGRLTGFFSYDNLGIIITDPKLQFYPFALYEENAGLWKLATFNMEAVVELLIFFLLLTVLAKNRRQSAPMRGSDGDVALLFVMLHGAATVVFDSMHMDALRWPGNSFVMLQQIIAAVSLLGAMMVFMGRSVKRDRLKPYHVLSLLVFLSVIGICVYMELDRISDTNYFRNHGVMAVAMICASAIGLTLYRTSLPDDTPTEQ